jgi:hypothetical protein
LRPAHDDFDVFPRPILALACVALPSTGFPQPAAGSHNPPCRSAEQISLFSLFLQEINSGD